MEVMTEVDEMNLEDMIPIAEYARKIGKATITVADKCRRGALPGAQKIGRDWFVPKNAEYPDFRVKSGRYVVARKNKDKK